MRKNFFKLLLALAVMLPVSALTSCSEDAPAYAYSIEEDLVGKWTWSTDAGDLTETFDVTVSKVSDSEISIGNFHNLGSSITAKLSGNSFTFSGDLNSDFEVRAGSGSISNGYQTITLSYDIYDKNEEETESIKAKMNKGVAAKKAKL